MIPFNDTEPNRYSFFPFMTVMLIFLCTAVFILERVMIGEDVIQFALKYGITPGLVMLGVGGGMLSNITSMFLHVDIFHLLGNMLSLWVFGRRVEDACGPWRFLAFYLMAGTGANILYTLVQSNFGSSDMMPGVGASGAIFGVMGAYWLLYPSGRIRTYILPAFVARIRAFWVVLYFVAVQIGPALNIVLHGDSGSQVNNLAHLGGFFSSVLILLFVRPAAYARYMSDTLV